MLIDSEIITQELVNFENLYSLSPHNHLEVNMIRSCINIIKELEKKHIGFTAGKSIEIKNKNEQFRHQLILSAFDRIVGNPSVNDGALEMVKVNPRLTVAKIIAARCIRFADAVLKELESENVS